MVLMTIDHTNMLLNPGRLAVESSWWSSWTPAGPYSNAEFWTRWVSHLCAPTFVFLAGTSLAIRLAKIRSLGNQTKTFDRQILFRGLLLLVLELLWMSWVMGMPLLQVLYALGGAMLCMIVLRHLSPWLLTAGATAILVLQEPWIESMRLSPDQLQNSLPPLWSSLLLTPGYLPVNLPFGIPTPQNFGIVFAYPLLPWLAVMMLGWSFGKWLQKGDRSKHAAPLLLGLGLFGIALSLLLQTQSNFGNLWLEGPRDHYQSIFLISKYGPSLNFLCSQLGLMAVLLAFFWMWQTRKAESYSRSNPLLVFGRAPLFFYVLHIHLLALILLPFGLIRAGSVETVWWVTPLCLFGMYPLCRFFLAAKARNPAGWTRFF